MVIKIERCPRCGYYGPIECIESLGFTGAQCTCPECDYRISDLRKTRIS